MIGIFKKDNVYVTVIDQFTRKDIQKENMDTLIFSPENEYHKKEVLLYGGRVSLKEKNSYYDVSLSIDGIKIQYIQYSDYLGYDLSEKLNIEKATAYLNQMENLGIDTFLENYKQQLVTFKKEMEEKLEKMEQEQSLHYDEKKVFPIQTLKKQIFELAITIFFLLINMNAGLDNQTYTDAYNEIFNLYF